MRDSLVMLIQGCAHYGVRLCCWCIANAGVRVQYWI